MKLTIEKVTGTNRHRGDPDYRISFVKQWVMNIYPDRIETIDWSHSTGYPSKDILTLDIENEKPLYHLLESRGCESVALLYKDYLSHFHPFYNFRNFPNLSPQVLVAHLVHYTIWEPEKIEWV